MIQVVTFDFWQTLIIDTPENLQRGKELRLEGTASVLARVGRSTRPEDLEAAYEASGIALTDRFWANHRDPPYREQVKIFLELAAPGVTADLSPELFAEAVAAYITPVLRLLPRPVAGAVEALSALRELGVTLGIISNTGRTPGVVLRKVLDHHGLLGYFTVLSYSDEVGYRKPHPAIFTGTLRRAGAEPGHALHVGDDADADVAGARSVGMRVGHFRAGGGSPAPGADFVLHHFAELPDRVRSLP